MFGLNWNYGDLLDLQLGILVLGADHKDHKVHVFGNCSKCGKVGFKRLKVLGKVWMKFQCHGLRFKLNEAGSKCSRKE